MPNPDERFEALLREYEQTPTVQLRDELHARYLQLHRGGATPAGLPYPGPLDPLSEGADAIRALAEAFPDMWVQAAEPAHAPGRIWVHPA